MRFHTFIPARLGFVVVTILWGAACSRLNYSGGGTSGNTSGPAPSPSASPSPAVTLSATQYTQRVLNDGALMLHLLNETGGSEATDMSGNGLNGTYFNNPILNQFGPLTGGSAPIFDGVSQYVSIPHSPVFTVTTFTVEVWFRIQGANATGIYNTLASKGNGTGYGKEELFQLMVFNSTGLLGGRVGYGTTVNELYSLKRVDDGAWHHAAMTVNHFPGADSFTLITLYLDGEPQATLGINGVAPFSAASGPVNLGAWITPSTYGPLNGQLMGFAFYGSALTASQIANHVAP